VNYRMREMEEESKFNEIEFPINYESNSDDENLLNHKPLVDRNDTQIRDLRSALHLGSKKSNLINFFRFYDVAT
jgi:hypothetical protein